MHSAIRGIRSGNVIDFSPINLIFPSKLSSGTLRVHSWAGRAGVPNPIRTRDFPSSKTSGLALGPTILVSGFFPEVKAASA